MIPISEVHDRDLHERLQDYQEKGGVLEINVYRIAGNTLREVPQDDDMVHLVVARQAMDKVNYQCNFHWNKVAGQGGRSDCPVYSTD